MADLLANINQIDYKMRTKHSEMTYISQQISNLERKKDQISMEYDNLASQRRTLGLEQYKDREFRRRLLEMGRESSDTNLIVIAIQLEKTDVVDGSDLSDEAINFFVEVENINRRITNTNFIGRMFDMIGKVAYKNSIEEICNDN